MPSKPVISGHLRHYPRLGVSMSAHHKRSVELIDQVDQLSRDVLCVSPNTRHIELQDVDLAPLPSDPLYAMKKKVSGEVKLDERGRVILMDLKGNNERLSYEIGNSWFGLGDEREIYAYERLDEHGFVHQEQVASRDYGEWLYSWNSV